MYKKLIPILLALFVSVPFSVIATNVDNEDYYWIEAEYYNNMDGGFSNFSCNNASGGQGLLLSSATSVESTATYEVEIAKENIYNIWILSADPNNQWLSKYKYCIDDNGFVSNNNVGVDSIYTIPGHGMSVGWSKLESARLNVGAHSLKLMVDEARQAGGMYQAFDAIAIVPSNWNWRPGKTLDKPFVNESNALWIEGDEYTGNQGEFIVQTDSKASASSAMYIHTDKDVASTLSYSFTPRNSGKYNAYLLASPAAVDYATALKYKTTGQDDYKRLTSYNSLKNAYTSANGMPANWYKLTTMDMQKGNFYDLSFLADERRAQGDYIWQWIDAIVILKDGYDFTLSDLAVGNEVDTTVNYDTVEIEKAMLDIYGFNPLAISSDIILPTRGASGSFISWNSSDTSIANIKGNKVIINRSILGDRNVTITATINPCKNSIMDTTISATKSFDLTVLKNDNFTVSNCELKYSDGTNIGDEFIAGKAVKASATIKNNQLISDNAVVLLMFYDQFGTMKLVKAEQKSITTNESVNYELEFTFPQDVTKGLCSLYLWNNMQDMISLVSGIEK